MFDLIRQVNPYFNKGLSSIAVSVQGTVQPPIYTIVLRNHESKEDIEAEICTSSVQVCKGSREDCMNVLSGMLTMWKKLDLKEEKSSEAVTSASKGELKSIVSTLKQGLEFLTENKDMGDADDQETYEDCEQAIGRAEYLLQDGGSELIIKFEEEEQKKYFIEYLDCESEHFIEFMQDNSSELGDKWIRFTCTSSGVTVSAVDAE